MKKLITLIALAAAVPVFAQTYGVITPSGVPNNIALATTSNTTVNIDCRKQKNVAVYLKVASDGAANEPVTNIVLTFNKSLDGTTFSTVASDKFTWTVPLALGTDPNYATTNFNVGALGYIRLVSIESQDATNSCTNIVFKYALKIKAD